MFFALSKIFWSLVQPLNALCLLALAGLILRLKWPRAGQGMITCALAFILILGILPIGPVLLTYLERQYPTPKELPAQIDGILLLGGPFEAYLSEANGQMVINEQIERVLCFMQIAKLHPEAKLVWSGGPGDILNPEAMEGNEARKFFDSFGFPANGGPLSITYEEKSRNTYENALYSKELLNPKAGEHWVVTTSAYHMPRTVGIFEKLGWRIIPYQCDLRTDGSYTDTFAKLPNVTNNFSALNIALKEIVGNFAYFLTGKSALLLPSSPVPSETQHPSLRGTK